jgi:hypothetical protein
MFLVKFSRVTRHSLLCLLYEDCFGYIDLYLPSYFCHQTTLFLPHQRCNHAAATCLLAYWTNSKTKRLLCDTTTGMLYSSQRIPTCPYKNSRLLATMCKTLVNASSSSRYMAVLFANHFTRRRSHITDSDVLHQLSAAGDTFPHLRTLMDHQGEALGCHRVTP